MNEEFLFRYILISITVLLVIIFVTDYNCIEGFIGRYYGLDWSDPLMMSRVNDADWMMNSVSCNYTDNALEWCVNGYDVPESNNGILRAHST